MTCWSVLRTWTRRCIYTERAVRVLVDPCMSRALACALQPLLVRSRMMQHLTSVCFHGRKGTWLCHVIKCISLHMRAGDHLTPGFSAANKLPLPWPAREPDADYKPVQHEQWRRGCVT